MTGELLALFEEDDVIDEIKMIRAKVTKYFFKSYLLFLFIIQHYKSKMSLGKRTKGYAEYFDILS